MLCKSATVPAAVNPVSPRDDTLLIGHCSIAGREGVESWDKSEDLPLHDCPTTCGEMGWQHTGIIGRLFRIGSRNVAARSKGLFVQHLQTKPNRMIRSFSSVFTYWFCHLLGLRHRFPHTVLVLITALCAVGCMEYGPIEPIDMTLPGRGLFISNEGNFTYGNASLCYYDITNSQLITDQDGDNDIFLSANGIPLGDVAQSVTSYGNTVYVVVNNSGVIFAIDRHTAKITGTIRGLTSPRYMYILSDTKAYVTDLYARAITIVDPSTCQITGRIDVSNGIDRQHPTEQMVQYKNLIFTNCWSYDDKLLVIDSDQDKVVDSITVGIQPNSIALDCNNKLWVLTDGGYEGSPYGQEQPTLSRIDAESRNIELQLTFPMEDAPSEICLNGSRDSLYFLNKDVWCMKVTDEQLPQKPFLKYTGTLYYGLAIDPKTSEVYVADAIDYVQYGVVYRLSPQAVPLDTIRVGITPGSFCFVE